MLILKYFLAVGTALTLGLIALSAHMESEHSARASRMPTTASLPVAPVKAPVAEIDLAEPIAPAPEQKLKSSRSSSSSRQGTAQRPPAPRPAPSPFRMF
jgi:hypothetical protein